MSRYSTRKMHPKPRLILFLGKLLNAKSEPSLFGSTKLIFPKTGNSVIVKPHWITESN